jgi:Fe(3+) dicitrate transport protein
MSKLTKVLAGFSLCLLASQANAQDAAQKSDLPDVEVIQQQKQTPAKKPAAPKPQATTTAPAPAEPDYVPATVEPEFVEDAPVLHNPIYGAANSGGAAARAQNSPTTPSNPTSILPGNLEGFSSAGTRITTEILEQDQPRTLNESLRRVPGLHVVSDDGYGRHGGVGMRGSPPRRGRKVLHLEDGQPINMSVWLDPSVHYTPPIDRLESIEVLRGVVISHGPLNNHGVVNFRNLSPFGPNETVVSASIGWVDNGKGGGFVDDPGDPAVFSTADQSPSNTRHFHTRQGIGNVGVVFSYSGADAEGAWDNERLRYNDFYGAIGWRGQNSDLTFSAVHFRQRDDYDEANFEGTEAKFFDQVGHCKTCYNVGSNFNTYNADVTKLQLVHNAYLDDKTTITSRLYGFHHRRDRYQNLDEANPAEAEDMIAPFFDAGTSSVYVGEGAMLGRLRTYRQLGAEMRGEWADRPFIAGLRQDIQAGVRYEWNDFTNKNFFGTSGQVLKDGDKDGFTAFDREYEAHAFSTYLQSTLHMTSDFNVTPGVRIEHYRIKRKTFGFITKEEGELDELDDCDADSGVVGGTPFGTEECLQLELENPAFPSEKFTKTHVLPGVALAYKGFYRSTVYGGYNRGLSTHVLREERFPSKDEIGDNFQLGLRSSAFMGLTFDVAGFYQRIEDFQIKGSGTDGAGNNIYSAADEVEIKGFEAFGRLESKPYTGGPFNFFFEGTYTLSDAEFIKDIETPEIIGNSVPEVPRQVAHLTLGMQHRIGLDASVSWTYRSAFFTDETNTPFGGDDEGEDGEVPSIWLLSARASMKIGDTGASVFIAGDNLLDKLYISDREDGIKPGQGRSVRAGFKYKF